MSAEAQPRPKRKVSFASGKAYCAPTEEALHKYVDADIGAEESLRTQIGGGGESPTHRRLSSIDQTELTEIIEKLNDQFGEVSINPEPRSGSPDSDDGHEQDPKKRLRSASRTSARVARGPRRQHSFTSESSARSNFSQSSFTSFTSYGTTDSRSLLSTASRRSQLSSSTTEVLRHLTVRESLSALKPALFIPAHEIQVDEDPMSSSIGEGGQGSCFVGWLHNNPVVVKVSSEDSVLSEFILLERLKHPNIVRVRGYSAVAPAPDEPSEISSPDADPSENSWIFLAVYDYYPNRDLAAFLRGNPLRRRDANFMRNVFDGILNALDYLHSNRLVHTDVKPDNCLLDSHLNVSLADFGMCQSMSQTMVAQGTPSYLAPEIVLDWFTPEMPHSFTDKVDIFSFGVLMVYCLTGHYPFNRITMRLQSGVPFTPAEAEKFYVPSEKRLRQMAHLDQVFAVMARACLNYKPEKRPSAAELRAILNLPRRQGTSEDHASTRSP